MIICPNCKEEIDDDSHYCDQCGQALLFCNRCGKVGLGKRCTYCGGLMLRPGEEVTGPLGSDSTVTHLYTTADTTQQSIEEVTQKGREVSIRQSPVIPTLTLFNGSLNIRLTAINGAIIGRRQGPYKTLFTRCMYISGVHAQLSYEVNGGWSITDKHSSNGTKVNQRPLKPDEPAHIKSGDVVSLADINLQASIN